MQFDTLVNFTLDGKLFFQKTHLNALSINDSGQPVYLLVSQHVTIVVCYQIEELNVLFLSLVVKASLIQCWSCKALMLEAKNRFNKGDTPAIFSFNCIAEALVLLIFPKGNNILSMCSNEIFIIVIRFCFIVQWMLYYLR